jgi:hypothetical protein
MAVAVKWPNVSKFPQNQETGYLRATQIIFPGSDGFPGPPA